MELAGWNTSPMPLIPNRVGAKSGVVSTSTCEAKALLSDQGKPMVSGVSPSKFVWRLTSISIDLPP